MSKTDPKHSKSLSNGDKILIKEEKMETPIISSSASSMVTSTSSMKKHKSNKTFSLHRNETQPNMLSPVAAKSFHTRSYSSFSKSNNNNNNNSNSVGKQLDVRKSTKRKSNSQKKFQQLFPSVHNEIVIATYSCAYVKSLNLLHGEMFLTKNYICFYSKILSVENILIIKFQHILSVKKANHALIFPTAIRIETQNSGYQFTSFLSRTNTLEKLTTLLLGKPIYDKKKKSEPFNDSSKINTTSETSRDLYSHSCHNIGSEEDDYEVGDSDLTTDIMLINDEPINVDLNNNVIQKPVKTFFNDFIAYDQRKTAQVNKNTVSNSYYNYYDIDYSDLSSNKVTVTLRHKKTLLQKVKILISLLIPAYFDISRIDSLLPICFLMCILLLLNAFVLLNKVSKVDQLFADILINPDMILN